MKIFQSVGGAMLLALGLGGSVRAATTVGSGNVVSEARAVSGFHGVELAGVGDLSITQGDQEGLVVQAEDNLLPLIETRVKPDGTLRLGFKDGSVQPTKGVHFHLAVKTLDRVELAGSGNVRAEKLAAEHEKLVVAGSGNIRIDQLETGSLTLALEGSGAVKLGGAAAKQTVALTGSGNYDAGGLKTNASTVEVSGSGECKVWAEKALTVNVSGSGEVGYYGTPQVVRRVSGSGEVRALGAGGR